MVIAYKVNNKKESIECQIFLFEKGYYWDLENKDKPKYLGDSYPYIFVIGLYDNTFFYRTAKELEKKYFYHGLKVNKMLTKSIKVIDYKTILRREKLLKIRENN